MPATNAPAHLSKKPCAAVLIDNPLIFLDVAMTVSILSAVCQRVCAGGMRAGGRCLLK
jgi:hypothetical protein